MIGMDGLLPVSTTVWVAAVIGLCLAGASWIYGAMWAIAMGPVQAHVFRLSSGEGRLVRSRLGRRRARKVRRDLAEAADCGPAWSSLTTLLGEHYVELRAANYLVFLPTVVLACTLLGFGVVQLLAAAPIAFVGGDMALAYGSVATVVGSMVPGVLTFTAMRLRWRRRAPFEVRWVHEASLLLRKYGDGDTRTPWERGDLLPDLSDLHYVLRGRYSRTMSVPGVSDRDWRIALQGWQNENAVILEAVGPSTAMTRRHARRQVEHSARLVMQSQTRSASQPEPTVDVRRVHYSADSATLLFLAGLGTTVAIFAALSFFASQPSQFAAIRWERVEPVLNFVVVAVPAAGVVGAAVNRWLQGRRIGP